MSDESFGGLCQTCRSGYVVGGRCVVCGATPPPPESEAEDTTELDRTMMMLSVLLTRTADALKGAPAELTKHSWHDLPELAQQLHDFAEEVASDGCRFGDNCTREAQDAHRHGVCLPCKARAALSHVHQRDETETT